MKTTRWETVIGVAAIVVGSGAASSAEPLGTAFTYQGQLKQGGVPVDGLADFEFTLWDDAATPPGVQVGSTLTFDGQGGNPAPIDVVDGLFTAQLDFGADTFDGVEARWLEVAVRFPVGGGAYTTLDPRQALTPAPFALQTRGITVDDNGNVGIGTDNPSSHARLHVADGSIWADHSSNDQFPNVFVRNHNGGWAFTPGGGAYRALWASTTSDTSDDKVAISGRAGGADGRQIGVFGMGSSAFAGPDPEGIGVYGVVPGRDNDKAIYGQLSDYSSGWAGYFDGNVYANGNLGIETETPGFPLTFANTVGDKISLWGQSGSHYGFGIQSSLLQIHTNSAGADIAFGYGSSDSFTETMRIGGSGHVGIGMAPHTTPQLAVTGNAEGVYGRASTATGSTTGGWFEADSADGAGLRSYGGKYGVDAVAERTSGEAYGGWFSVASSSGRGVFGRAVSATGTTYGGYFQSSSSSGYGVYAKGGAYGMYAVSDWHGLYSHSNATSGQACGLIANTASPNGFGVWGGSENVGVLGGVGSAGSYWPGSGVAGMAVTGIGVSGLSNSGPGLYGTSGTGDGVYGASNGSAMSGVSGYNPQASGYGVYCAGNFAATGTKAFQIDHPLDPANEVLNHYCAEGPEPLNVYSGTVVLNAEGQARVALPDYFESINRDFRYQLTCIGGFAPVYVAEEIADHTFLIAGGQPGLKVSWEVKGVRNDAYMRTYGAPVELEKPAEQRGKYLQPELYGQSRDLGINCTRHQVVKATTLADPTEPPTAED